MMYARFEYLLVCTDQRKLTRLNAVWVYFDDVQTWFLVIPFWRQIFRNRWIVSDVTLRKYILIYSNIWTFAFPNSWMEDKQVLGFASKGEKKFNNENARGSKLGEKDCHQNGRSVCPLVWSHNWFARGTVSHFWLFHNLKMLSKSLSAISQRVSAR